MNGYRIREAFRSSLWVVPAAFVLAALGLAGILALLDDPLGGVSWLRFPGSAETARTILATIGGAMITFTGLVFSITVLVLQLASQQYSPRVLKTFMQDRISKIALGMFVATFVFSVTALVRVGAGSVPGVAMGVAVVLVLASIGVFVQYINHVASSIQVSSIIDRVAETGRTSIDDTFPPADEVADGASRVPDDLGPVTRFVDAPKAGRLQHADIGRLVRLARDANGVFELLWAIGDFAPEGAPVFALHGDGLGEEAGEKVLDSISMGRQRTPSEDTTFAIRSLVDIGERALSPTLNDPTTAVQAIDAIHDLLRRVVVRPWPPSVHRDEDGTVRLVTPQPTWDDYVALATTEIRRCAEGSVQVLRRLHAMLGDLLAVAPVDRRGPIERELHLVRSAAVRLEPEQDASLAVRRDAQGLGGP